MSNENENLNLLVKLIESGIQVDKNLRQPTYYSSVYFDELCIESTCIITDLLTNQRIPYWLSQRIAWYYSNKYFQEIVTDLSMSNQNDDGSKNFTREKLVIYLRNSISSIIKEWLNERSNFNNQNIDNLLFSINRTDKNSKNKTIFYEYGLKNKRRTMEDRTSILENIDVLTNFCSSNSQYEANSKKLSSIFAVYDGHCGSDCVQYVSTHLPFSIMQDFQSSEPNINQIIKKSFSSINEKFKYKAINESLKSGCTACVAIISEEKATENQSLTVAWCGDSQFFLVKNGQIKFLSPIHRPEIESEKIRIESSGGTVSYEMNTWRVNGSLSVSRSFGDVQYQSFGITSEPDVVHFDLDGSEDYFILACDGFWESVNDKLLTKLIYENRNCNNIAEFLVMYAKEHGSTDNISLIFVLLKNSFDELTVVI
ncbi:phosphatase [Brachionus plicatilis]|uniref:Phosphatase n=1 Tax=Brachionus plicatilis TaxID=10195 RepID=A0A3M7PJU9_BRAPC|nr:phosphatase [Brachionus plicatilis]